jgi:diguanylate cyclase (GGDEF)-like protein
MKRNRNVQDTHDPNGQKAPGGQSYSPSSDRRKSVQTEEHVSEGVMSGREQSVAAREEVSHVLQEAEMLKDILEKHIARLRQANEHLIIATMQAQTMTEEVQKAKDQMGHMAHHDFLTDLPNRILLGERLDQAISLAKRHDAQLAVLFIDLDRFKTINDSLGHAIGDALLQAVAQRLISSVRRTDTVSRQGGDEFVVVLSEAASVEAVAGLAEKVCQAVSQPYALAAQDLHIGATIGISMYPDDGTDAETLILNADIAMYHAKNNGRGGYRFFAPAMNIRAVERQRIEADLHRALNRQEFELHYQAQVDLQTGSIIGVEALVRWRHPMRGLLLPAVFVPVAEECGAIVPLGRWVLHEACRQTKAWQDAGLQLKFVAVNISAIEFRKKEFLANVRDVLRETRLAPHHLELEMTETVLMGDAESTMSTLHALSAMGVKIAVDDFGTGYSSLNYLQRFPVDTLKIGQSFVAGIVPGSGDEILVDSVINLGKNLRQRVIAEGVETREQLTFLSSHQCAEGQGFFLSQPVIADEFTALLGTGLPPGLFPHSASLH